MNRTDITNRVVDCGHSSPLLEASTGYLLLNAWLIHSNCRYLRNVTVVMASDIGGRGVEADLALHNSLNLIVAIAMHVRHLLTEKISLPVTRRDRFDAWERLLGLV